MTRGAEDDAAEIARLTQEGLECKDTDPEEAIEKFHTAYQKSRQIDDDFTERICAFNLGAAYVCVDKARDGLKFLHKAIPPEGEIESGSTCSGDLYFNMGMAYEKLQEDINALKYYQKAHSEFFKGGGTNMSLQMHCLQKCLELQEKLKRFADAAHVYRQMAAINYAKNDYLNQADCMCKMAIQCRKAKNFEAAADGARECQNVFNNFTPEGQECFVAGRILNEVGLLCTQMQHYDVASQCFERALQFVNEGDGDNPQLEVVVKQNLGAAYNFQGDFQRAIKFHEEAIDLHTKLNYRNGQGQCFTNLAFALSQEPQRDLRRAEVAFHHALRASIETKDTNMKWQVLEGLGAVNYQQGNVEDAINCFQDALQCPNNNKGACERIKGKLRQATEYCYAMRNATPGFRGQPTEMTMGHTTGRLGTIREGSNTQESILISQETPNMSRLLQQAPPSAQERMPRRIPIRKQDSFGPHMQKVARGLTTMSMDSDRATPRMSLLVPESGESSEDSSSGSGSGSTSGSSSDEDEVSEEVRSERVNEIFSPKKGSPGVARHTEGSPYRNTQSAVPKTEAEMYQEALREKEAREEESDSDSDSDSSGESSGDSDDDSSSDEDHTQHETERKRVHSPPPAPTQSPPCTSRVRTQDLATYQLAQKNAHSSVSGSSGRVVQSGVRQATATDLTDEEEEEEEDPYAVIDQATRSQKRQADEGNTLTKGAQINRQQSQNSQTRQTGHRKGSNFFDSEEESSLKESERQSSKNEAPSPRGDRDESDTDVRPQDKQQQQQQQPAEYNLPRGQQEHKLFQEHQRYQQEHAEPPALPPRHNEKQSKTCAIM